MTRKEKIIKGLEYCTTHYNCREVNGEKCPFIDECEPIEDVSGGTLELAALELLKEQETPVEVITTYSVNGLKHWYCSNCPSELPIPVNEINYCPNCGRRLKWND